MSGVFSLARLLNVLVAVTALAFVVAITCLPGVLEGHGTELWKTSVIFVSFMAVVNTLAIAMIVIPKDFGRMAREYNQQLMVRVSIVTTGHAHT